MISNEQINIIISYILAMIITVTLVYQCGIAKNKIVATILGLIASILIFFGSLHLINWLINLR